MRVGFCGSGWAVGAGRRWSVWYVRIGLYLRAVVSSRGRIGCRPLSHSDGVWWGGWVLILVLLRGGCRGRGPEGHTGVSGRRHFWTWTHIHFPSARGRGS